MSLTRTLVSVPLCVFLAAGSLTACSGTPAYIPPGPLVTVQLLAKNSESKYAVTIKSDDAPEQRCEVPCALTVPSGSAVASISGSRNFTQQIVIPNSPSSGEIREARLGQAIAGGSVALVGTLVGLSAGIAAAVQSLDACPSGSWDPVLKTCDLKYGEYRTGAQRQSLSSSATSGLVSGAGWLVAVAGYLVAATSGKNEIVFKPTLQTARDRAPSLRLVDLSLAPTRGKGATAGVTLSF